MTHTCFTRLFKFILSLSKIGPISPDSVVIISSYCTLLLYFIVIPVIISNTSNIMGTAPPKLQQHIIHLRHTLLCLDAIITLLGIALISLCLWVRFDPDVQEWVQQLNVSDVYTGVYILIVASLLMIASGVLSCMAVLSENQFLMAANVAYHVLCFVFGLAGAAVLMDYSTYQSSIQGIIRRVMLSLINLSPLNQNATGVLSMVQENMGCCGADGPNDYMNARRALPSQCRDTVTGNAFFYGCADELTWFLEQRSSWISGVACFLCFLNILNASLTLVLAQAVKKDSK